MVPNALFKLFGNGVYLYGICIAIGLVACILFFFYFTKRRGMPENVQEFAFFVTIIAIAVGFLFAKLYQAIYVWMETGKFDFYSAGITVMGGLIGGAAMFILSYFVGGKIFFKGSIKGVHVKHFYTIVLVAPMCILIAHAFGRIGCLMAGCCHGTYLGSDYVVGGIYMYGTVNGYHQWGYYIPTQLYEALFLFIAFGVLWYLYEKKGATFTMPAYLISYGAWRMIIEIFRGDAARVENLALGLTPSQWQSIFFILGGAAYILIIFLKKASFFEKEKILSKEQMLEIYGKKPTTK